MGTESFDSDDFIHQELTKLGPKNIRAERATFMSRTSDTLGEFVKTDINSYLDLIRRKVQQKCSTIQELMHQIRINKISEASAVTPAEFRVTLIKFGVILPQPLIDNIFRVFDTDRSGTMDFDEFATWIMNSEFRPHIVGLKHDKYDSMEEVLRKKVLKATQNFPASWNNMKNKMNFMELVAEINRFDMHLNEGDVRSLFLMFDGKNNGDIDIPAVMLWARNGRMTRSQQATALSRSQRTMSLTKGISPTNIKEAIFNVCGRSTNLLSESFAHFPKGEGVKIGYDEFWRCLLAKGLSKPKDSKSLFIALGGDGALRGSVNIDILLEALPSVQSIQANSGTAPSSKSPQRKLVPISRADRNLREAVRKNFKFIQKLFFNADTDNCGFLSFEVIHKLINKSVMPINHEDLRHISKQLIQDDQNRFSYNHLLMMYDPKKAPHVLDGPFETASLAGDVVNAFTMANAASNNQLGEGDMDDSASSSAVITTQNKKGELRGWRQVLKYCQDADVKKIGVVLREVFMKAVKIGSLEAKMGASKLMDIIDHFTVGNGQVDYKACYRSVSTGSIDSILATKSPSRRGSKGKAWQVSSGSASYNDINSQFFADSNSMSQSKSTGRFANATMTSPLAVSESSRVGLLNKFEPQVVGILRKCNKVLSPIWRQLRQELKHYGEVQMKGYISTPNFVRVMASCGIDLDKKEVAVLSPAFSGERKNAGFIKFDDFMRAALVSSPKILSNM